MPMSTLTMEETRASNERLFDLLDRGQGVDENVKMAADEITSFTRTTIREDGFLGKIIPAHTLTDNTMLTRTTDTDKPSMVFDREPDSPAAISFGFGDFPSMLYVRGRRYRLTFYRISTYMFAKDVDELRTWQMDLRQVISDNSIRDMMAEEDGKFLRGVDDAMIGLNQTVAQTGSVHYVEIDGGITRETLWESMNVLPATPTNLEVHTCLVNQLTIKDVAKLSFSQMGGSLAEEIMRDGWSLQTFMGRQWIITIKKGLVGRGTVYQFADPEFIGKHIKMADVTMYVRREGPMVYWYAYETLAAGMGNLGCARVDFVNGDA